MAKHSVYAASKVFGEEKFHVVLLFLSSRANVVDKLPLIINKNMFLDIQVRSLLLNCVNDKYSELWKTCFQEKYKEVQWAKQDKRLDNSVFTSLTKELTWETSLRKDYHRREALIELDVLVSMELGMTLSQLIDIYQIQFPVLKSYEAETWYDQNGRIVFTVNRSLTGVGLSRKEWEEVKDKMEGSVIQTITDDTMPGGPIERTIEYIAPFNRCDREKDYEEVWANFEKRFANQEGGVL